MIMPAYNASATIFRAAYSVLRQSYNKLELIIIDDASQDDTARIMQDISSLDARVRLLKATINSGPAHARNQGIAAAKGEYVAFLDADDFWLPEKLTLQIAEMDKHNLAFTFTSYYHCDPSGKILKQIHVPTSITRKQILYGSQIGCLTVVYSVKILGKTYMSVEHPKEDYLTWISILKKCSGFGLLTPLAGYTISTRSLSSNKSYVWRWQWNVYRNGLGFSRVKSSWYFSFYMVKGIIKHYM